MSDGLDRDLAGRSRTATSTVSTSAALHRIRTLRFTDVAGRYVIITVRPGAIGDGQAPHIDVSVFARGLLDRVVTRIYFPDDPANATDPLLAALPPARAATLVAVPTGPGELRFDITLQGADETVFLTV